MTNEELVRAFCEGDKNAMGEIIENNQGLVYPLLNLWHRFSSVGNPDT